jgi:hypothetical protein
MKKTFLIIVVLIAQYNISLAQNGAFRKGDKLLNLGIGVNSYYDGGIPVGASFEVGITDAVSVGGNIDYFSRSYGYYSNDYKYSILYLGGRGSYHFNKLLRIRDPKVDLYAGAVLGYRIFSWRDNYSGNGLNNTYSSGLYLGGFAGAKYYFNKGFGVFAEVGAIGSTNARIGVAFKF